MFRRFILPTGLAALALAAPISAQATPTGGGSHPLLERMGALFEHPFECDVELNVQGDPGEGANGKARVAYGSKRTFSISFGMSIADGQQTQAVTFKVVADGRDVIAEMTIPNMAGTQAFKISLDALEELQEQVESMGDMGFGGMPGMAGMPGMSGDPAEQIKQLMELFNFQEREVDGGKTTRFSALLDPDTIQQTFGEQLEETLKLTFDVDTETAFPKQFSITGEAGQFIRLTTRNVRFPTSIPASRFRYEPPEGVFVMDLTPMLQGQFQQLQQHQGGNNF